MDDSLSTASLLMPIGHCYSWQPDVLWLHVGSDILIALAYFIIPVSLYVLWAKSQRKFPHKDLLFLFITFIFLCGCSHLMAIVTTWEANFFLEGWVKALTASVSIVTALVLIPKTPELLALNVTRDDYDALKRAYEALESRNSQMNAVYQAALGREDRITQLKKEINSELANQGLAPRYEIYQGNE